MKTVNFIEGFNSKRRFYPIDYRPRCGSKWFIQGDSAKYGKNILINDHETASIPTVGLVNAKFVIEEKSITITESQFDEAWSNAQQGHGYLKVDFKRELGF